MLSFALPFHYYLSVGIDVHRNGLMSTVCSSSPQGIQDTSKAAHSVQIVPKYAQEETHSPTGMLSTLSTNCRQLLACSSAYFTLSCAHS